MVLLLLGYVAFLIPMRIGFFVEVKPGDGGFAMDVVTDIIFVLDIILNFRTGVISESGLMISDGRTMAKLYLKGWFPIDLLSCLPVSYVILIADSDQAGGGGSNSTKTIKILRLLRLGKLLRLARLKRILDSQFPTLDELLTKLVGVQLMLALFCLSHYVACFWHFVGDEDADPNWLQGVLVRNASLGTRYATSLYWASTALTSERGTPIHSPVPGAFTPGYICVACRYYRGVPPGVQRWAFRISRRPTRRSSTTRSLCRYSLLVASSKDLHCLRQAGSVHFC